MGLTLGILVAGCGDDKVRPPDAAVDAARICVAETAKTFDLFEIGKGYVGYAAALDTTIDGLGVFYVLEFWDGIEPTLAGTFDLTAGKQANYETCAACVLAFEVDSSNKLVKAFFQSAGTMTLASDPFVGKELSATVTGLELEEVTLDQMTAHSTPVPGGACATVADNAPSHAQAPNKWTCTTTDFSAGTACNCGCGAYDPDCKNAAATVVGCPNSFDACNSSGACTTPPPGNDTCATATVLTVDDPATSGRTVAGTADYDSGLATCTGQSGGQPGADVVYKVTLAASTAYQIKLTNASSTFDASLALVGPGAASDCDAAPIASCAAGADVNGAGGTETISYSPTAAGDYFIIVDSKDAAGTGTFDIQVTSM